MHRHLRVLGSLWLGAGLLWTAWTVELMYRIYVDPGAGWFFASIIPLITLAPGVLVSISGWGLVKLWRVSRGMLASLAASMVLLGVYPALAQLWPLWNRFSGAAFVVLGVYMLGFLLSSRNRKDYQRLTPGRIAGLLGIGFLATVVALAVWWFGLA